MTHFTVCIVHSQAEQGGDESVASDITRALMKALPKLFVKHQTDESRMADVLLIPQLMNLDLYLEMRMMTVCAYREHVVAKH